VGDHLTGYTEEQEGMERAKTLYPGLIWNYEGPLLQIELEGPRVAKMIEVYSSQKQANLIFFFDVFHCLLTSWAIKPDLPQKYFNNMKLRYFCASRFPDYINPTKNDFWKLIMKDQIDSQGKIEESSEECEASEESESVSSIRYPSTNTCNNPCSNKPHQKIESTH
jgi:hypothetical protein